MRISVKDTGTGMDGPTAERAFEPFFTTKASGEGTGMGLAVVHGIVGSLKGAITIDTKLDVGTTFHVMLPVIEQMAEKEIERSTPIPGGSECVLFVDDEKDIVKMEAHVLTSLGYEPVVAGNGREGLRLFELNPEKFDLVITDQVMPEMTGTEMAEAILRIRPDIPIILCTGFSEAVSPQQAKTLGIREFMLKPIVMRHLAETIRTVLDTVPSA
jgi:CheY-like chemotaxis protein